MSRVQKVRLQVGTCMLNKGLTYLMWLACLYILVYAVVCLDAGWESRWESPHICNVLMKTAGNNKASEVELHTTAQLACCEANQRSMSPNIGCIAILIDLSLRPCTAIPFSCRYFYFHPRLAYFKSWVRFNFMRLRRIKAFLTGECLPCDK